MADQTVQLFVYGTLMPGFSNYGRIADHVRSARPGTIQGVLVDLGAFPALIHGEGRVEGVLLELDAAAIRITDFIEGFHPEQESSLYVREMIQVDLDEGETIDAWTYYFANPEQIADRPRLIATEVDGISICRWPAE